MYRWASGKSEMDRYKLVFGFAGVFLVGLGAWAIRMGWLPTGRGYRIVRRDAPFSFWREVAGLILVGLGFLGFISVVK